MAASARPSRKRAHRDDRGRHLGILFFVLAKPIISLDAIAGEIAQPGWLEDSVVAPVVEALISWTR
jgi:hypothetical protein